MGGVATSQGILRELVHRKENRAGWYGTNTVGEHAAKEGGIASRREEALRRLEPCFQRVQWVQHCIPRP